MDVTTVAGKSHACGSVGVVTISMDKGDTTKVDILVVHGKRLAFDLLLEINVIEALGGIIVGPKGSVQTKAASEMPIRRQLSTLKELMKEYGLTVALVKSTRNIAN